MLALSPICSTLEGFLDEPLTHEHDSVCRETQSLELSNYFRLPEPENWPNLDAACTNTASTSGTASKKLNHNASERDRRKKMNSLYSSLRSLLPNSDQMKKLSIPETVSRVLDYIPELQQEVKKLMQRKEKILSARSMQRDLLRAQNKSDESRKICPIVISASLIENGEVLIQICSAETSKNLVSEILYELEKDGFLFLNSSFQSADRKFLNIHLQVHGTTFGVDLEMLKQKISSLYETKN